MAYNRGVGVVCAWDRHMGPTFVFLLALRRDCLDVSSLQGFAMFQTVDL